MSPCVWSVGQCDSNGLCTVKGGIKNGHWWRKELNSAQPECKSIDPEHAGTCHQWTVALDPPARNRVAAIKEMLADYILTTERVGLKRRVLEWNDPMDELYLSAPKHATGSDKVFVTPHIDGFVGWVPFMRAWRCVYGLTGPHDTVTIQPMRNPDNREVVIGPGVFTCFDYNREIHWIENRPVPGESSIDERMVLKIHFYEYPALLSFVGPAFGQFNAAYNFFARKAFLVSQFPDRSWFAKFVGAAINGITLYGGSAEAVYGYCNAGLLLSAFAAVRFELPKMVFWSGVLAGLATCLSLLFRSTTLGLFHRDALSLHATAMLLACASYARAWWAKNEKTKKKHEEPGGGGGGLLSAGLVCGGLALVCWALTHLGTDSAFHGRELASTSSVVRTGPYAFTSHPMALGWLGWLLGLRLHPSSSFRGKFHSSFLAHSWLAVLALFLEATDLHVPQEADYFSTFADFSSYHTEPGNVYAHLLTTCASVVGAFGLAYNLLSLHPKNKAGGSPSSSNAPLLTLSVTWLVCRFALPQDDDAAFLTVPLMALLSLAAWAGAPSNAACTALLVGGIAGQELAHWFYAEVAYLTAYAVTGQSAGVGGAGVGGKLATFALHNIWLVPFEVRAAINALSASLVPAMVPGTA